MSGNQLGTYSVTRVSFSTEGDQYLEIQCNRLLSVTSGCYAVMASSIQYKSQQHTLYKTQNKRFINGPKTGISNSRIAMRIPPKPQNANENQNFAPAMP